jgi:hypothetical protein
LRRERLERERLERERRLHHVRYPVAAPSVRGFQNAARPTPVVGPNAYTPGIHNMKK